jgi:hypothetical protein
MNKKLFTLVLNAVALGMGVASIVLGALGVVPTQTIVMLLAIGLSALALNQLDLRQDDED